MTGKENVQSYTGGGHKIDVNTTRMAREREYIYSCTAGTHKLTLTHLEWHERKNIQSQIASGHKTEATTTKMAWEREYIKFSTSGVCKIELITPTNACEAEYINS